MYPAPVPDRAALAPGRAADRRGRTAGHHRRRRGDLLRRHRRAAPLRRGPGSRSGRPRPARARCRTTTRRGGRPGRQRDRCANALADEADVMIGIGTRYTDFTTAVEHVVQQPGRAVRQHQRRRARRVQAVGARRWSADAREALDRAGRRCSAATASRTPTGPRRTRRRGPVARRGGSAITEVQDAPTLAQAEVIGARQRRRRRPRRRGQRGRVACPATCTGCGGRGSQGLPRGVRLLLHGLRGRRRVWASRWPTRPRRLRLRRRRLLPAVAQEIVDRGPGGPQDHGRAGATTTASPPSAPCRRPSARSASAPGTATATRARPARRRRLPVDLAANAASYGADVIRADDRRAS